MMAAELFLGLDSSTQGLKAVVLEKNGTLVLEHGVNYDQHLPHYKTTHGVYKEAHNVVTTPTLMLAEALDLLLDQINQSHPGLLAKVAAISGSGQQHGSVYWKKGAQAKLQALDGSVSFKDLNAKEWFSFENAPIWMDSSTHEQCKALEEGVGGPLNLATTTGSRAYERFTGLQIMKRAITQPDVFAQTERISLISSFMCSLLVGDYASIDESDGSGMNLMELKTMKWSEAALHVVSPKVPLGPLLGDIVSSSTVAGKISSYFHKRHHFNESCVVVAWSGDNPCSLAGLRISAPGDVGISLGTSDTVFCILDSALANPGLEGHVFRSPINGDTRSMSMLCYKNGSITRENVVSKANASWSNFSEVIHSTKPGNDGQIGFYFIEPEIIPLVLAPAIVRFDAHDNIVDHFPDQADVRGVVESQVLSMRLHAQGLGMHPKQIIITGGASVNNDIAQIISDIFGVSVYRSTQTNSAAVGAALRAVHGLQSQRENRLVSFSECTPPEAHHLAASPNMEVHNHVYNPMLLRYQVLEKKVLAGLQ